MANNKEKASGVAGLNPDALEGWILADVALEHGRGETAPRLLRNFSFEAD